MTLPSSLPVRSNNPQRNGIELPNSDIIRDRNPAEPVSDILLYPFLNQKAEVDGSQDVPARSAQGKFLTPDQARSKGGPW